MSLLSSNRKVKINLIDKPTNKGTDTMTTYEEWFEQFEREDEKWKLKIRESLKESRRNLKKLENKLEAMRAKTRNPGQRVGSYVPTEKEAGVTKRQEKVNQHFEGLKMAVLEHTRDNPDASFAVLDENFGFDKYVECAHPVYSCSIGEALLKELQKEGLVANCGVLYKVHYTITEAGVKKLEQGNVTEIKEEHWPECICSRCK